MLGHWDISCSVSQCEYQFGRRLVYVKHPKEESPMSCIAAAQAMLADVWAEIEGARPFADQASRRMLPDFWAIHDASGKSGFRFDVYSIHFGLPGQRPVYTVSTSQDFEFSYVRFDEADLWEQEPIVEQLPEPPPYFWHRQSSTRIRPKPTLVASSQRRHHERVRTDRGSAKMGPGADICCDEKNSNRPSIAMLCRR